MTIPTEVVVLTSKNSDLTIKADKLHLEFVNEQN